MGGDKRRKGAVGCHMGWESGEDERVAGLWS